MTDRRAGGDEHDDVPPWAPLDPGGTSEPPPPPAPAGAPPPPPGWADARPAPPPPGWADHRPPPPPPGWHDAPPPGWTPPRPLPKAGDARTGPLPLHPMTLGDVLDGSFKLFKANARTLLLVTAAVVVPLQLLSSYALRHQFDVGFLDLLRDPTLAEGVADEQQSLSQAVVAILTALTGALVTPFVAGAVARVVAASYLGRVVGPADALRAAGRRFPALLGAFVLVHLLELVGFVLCVLPGIALMAMFVLVAPAIAVEELGPVAAMRRSWRLVRPRFWAVLGISLLAGLIANTLSQILATVPALLSVVLGGSLAWLGVAVSGVVSQLVALPIVTIAATLLYFDARIRLEGLDLELIAAEVSGVARGAA